MIPRTGETDVLEVRAADGAAFQARSAWSESELRIVRRPPPPTGLGQRCFKLLVCEGPGGTVDVQAGRAASSLRLPVGGALWPVAGQRQIRPRRSLGLGPGSESPCGHASCCGPASKPMGPHPRVGGTHLAFDADRDRKARKAESAFDSGTLEPQVMNVLAGGACQCP
jgi:hypothetical protein